ncbi:hypothetical protein XELAEV_18043332mg [Xenopus laevis]|uniref:Uncharacterized protein n=1 Tax=Xenopus laevis TaxID=8355 RepID=A0A974BWI1_XENLA|nr:hypothetical protein XELAEV_18043332mg [Xenopus laevis]
MHLWWSRLIRQDCVPVSSLPPSFQTISGRLRMLHSNLRHRSPIMNTTHNTSTESSLPEGWSCLSDCG